jgi:hypothetical protein
MTASYWLIGRRIVEQEQGGQAGAGYGEALMHQATDLPDVVGRIHRGLGITDVAQPFPRP